MTFVKVLVLVFNFLVTFFIPSNMELQSSLTEKLESNYTDEYSPLLERLNLREVDFFWLSKQFITV